MKMNGGDRCRSSAEHRHPEAAQDENQQDLRREAGADDDFDDRAEPFERQHRAWNREVGTSGAGSTPWECTEDGSQG